jgi:hypothetical protein
MPTLFDQCTTGINPEKIKRFNSVELATFDDMAKELGVTPEQLGIIARRALLDVVTHRQLVEFVRA